MFVSTADGIGDVRKDVVGCAGIKGKKARQMEAILP